MIGDRLVEGERIGRFVVLRNFDGHLHAVAAGSVGEHRSSMKGQALVATVTRSPVARPEGQFFQSAPKIDHERVIQFRDEKNQTKTSLITGSATNCRAHEVRNLDDRRLGKDSRLNVDKFLQSPGEPRFNQVPFRIRNGKSCWIGREFPSSWRTTTRRHGRMLRNRKDRPNGYCKSLPGHVPTSPGRRVSEFETGQRYLGYWKYYALALGQRGRTPETDQAGPENRPLASATPICVHLRSQLRDE